ncbi:MAG: hypothetical protein PF569_08585 [Candidatus Woesearchaeota archaeon]|jgi:DNA-directed RNA polymerase subunit F|nr:hypothetical protein [Candidatus Woesearchaeota archaeon]
MSQTDSPVEKRTLLSARKRLQTRAKELNDLVRMSETLIEKFNRTEGEEAKKESSELIPENIEHPDLIGIFDDITSKMENDINILGSNLRQALNLID